MWSFGCRLCDAQECKRIIIINFCGRAEMQLIQSAGIPLTELLNMYVDAAQLDKYLTSLSYLQIMIEG